MRGAPCTVPGGLGGPVYVVDIGFGVEAVLARGAVVLGNDFHHGFGELSECEADDAVASVAGGEGVVVAASVGERAVVEIVDGACAEAVGKECQPGGKDVEGECVGAVAKGGGEEGEMVLVLVCAPGVEYGVTVVELASLTELDGVAVVVYGIDGEVECSEAVATRVGGEVEAVWTEDGVGDVCGYGAVAVSERGVLAESDGIVKVVDGVDREVECAEAVASVAGVEVKTIGLLNAVSYIGGHGAVAVG